MAEQRGPAVHNSWSMRGWDGRWQHRLWTAQGARPCPWLRPAGWWQSKVVAGWLADPHVNAARALFGTCSAQRLFPAPTLSVGGCSPEDPNPTTSCEARHLANKIWGPRRRPTNRLQQPTSKHAGAFYMVPACEATREDDDDLCTVLVVASCKREDHGRMHRRNQR
jgi:hypothetical protein